MKAGSPRKRIILVNRDLQFRYARLGLFVGFISTILSTVVILFPLYQFQILRIPNFLPIQFLLAMIFAVLINMMMITYLGVLITHRIAGPMFNLSREFADIGQGIFGKEALCRQSDDLKYLIRSFNEMSKNLENITHDDISCIDLALEKVQILVKNHPNSDKNFDNDQKSADDHYNQLIAISEIMTEFKSELENRINTKQ